MTLKIPPAKVMSFVKMMREYVFLVYDVAEVFVTKDVGCARVTTT